MYEIWESHLGGGYYLAEDQDWEDAYCDQCGDSDDYICSGETLEDLLNYIDNQRHQWDDVEASIREQIRQEIKEGKRDKLCI